MMSAGVIASVFKPSDLSNLVAWYDALDSSTITSDSDGVSQWSDKSGNGYHGTQATVAKRPDLSTSADNGLVAIDFDFASATLGESLLTTNPIWSYTERTTFVVCNKTAGSLRSTPYAHAYFRLKTTETAVSGILFAGDGSDSSFGDNTDEVYGISGTFNGDDNKAAKLSDTADGVDVLVQQSLKHTSDGTGAFMFAQKNAEAKVDQGTSGSPTLSQTQTDAADGQSKTTVGTIGAVGVIGGYSTSFVANSAQTLNPSSLWKGSIQEICDYNRNLSDAERNQVMGYLLGKWRVT